MTSKEAVASCPSEVAACWREKTLTEESLRTLHAKFFVFCGFFFKPQAGGEEKAPLQTEGVATWPRSQAESLKSCLVPQM